MDWTVVFSGFASKEQAEAFASWYSNSGEQDVCVSIWECADAKNITADDSVSQVNVELEITELDCS
jgi:Ni,Fe-hydrogenase III small subunit